MIQKILAKYGLAAHLGVLAAFPVVFAPFLTQETLGQTVLWLALVAALWMFAEPSVRMGEHLADARVRVLTDMVRDPLFYFALVAIAFALVRWLNSGIEVIWDSEQAKWLVREPAAEVFPASVGTAGFLPFVSIVALAVFVMAARHALGLQARVFCGLAAGTLVGAGGLYAAIAACLGWAPSLAKCAQGSFADVPFAGSAYGIFLILAVVFGMDAEVRKWKPARLSFVLATGGAASGLVFLAPPFVALVYLVVTLVFLIFSSVYFVRAGSMGGVARGLGLVLFGLFVPALLLMGLATPEIQQAKLRGLDFTLAFPIDYATLYKTLVRLAKEMWFSRPWLGVGEGGFALQAPFVAVRADWAVLPPHPQFALCGYWTLLAERGILGCAVLAVGLALLVWAWGARGIAAFRHLRTNDEADIFPFACPPVVWTAPFVLLLGVLELVISPAVASMPSVFAFIVALALAAASFPRKVQAPAPSTPSSPQQGK